MKIVGGMRAALSFTLASALLLGACGDDNANPQNPGGGDGDGDVIIPPPAPTFPRYIGGNDRPARLHVPKDYDESKAYPLVLMLHGFGANGGLQNFVFNLVERVNPFQFVLIVPEGTKNANGDQFWNAFLDCCNFLEETVDDVSYLTGLVEEAKGLLNIDEDRVTSLGHSNGGYMSFRLGCERSDIFRRVVSLAGSMPVDPSVCVPDHPVSVLHIHGTADDTVTYDDNRGTDGGDRHGIITRGAIATVEDWLGLNQCDETSLVAKTDDLIIPDDDNEASIETWSCAEGTKVTFWSLRDGDHLLLTRKANMQDEIAKFITE